MKRFVIVAALAALAVAPAARAEETGAILLGNPASAAGIGVTEIVDACTVGGPLAGLDGQWFAVSGGASVAVDLTGGALGVEDLDAYFYDSACGYINDTSMATAGTSESGTAPTTAAFMIVDLALGAQATFTVS